MAQEAQEPRLQKYDGRYYIFYNSRDKRGKQRSQRVSTRTDDLAIATARFQGWLDKSKINFQVENDPTVGRCLDLWFNDWIKDRMITEARYNSIINNLKEHFGNMPVSQVQKQHSEKYIEIRTNGYIGQCPAASGTIRGELQRLRACFRFMVERVEPKEQRLSLDVIPYVELPPPSPPRDRILDDDEVSLLRELCPNLILNGAGRRPSNRVSRVGRFIMLALETAQRKTAICELTWDRVDFETNRIHFNPKGRQQTKKKRSTVSMSPRLREALLRAKEEAISDYVLDRPTDVYQKVKAFGESIGIDDLTPHVFRHTWATRAVMRGVSLTKVAAMLGDKIKTVEDNYQHLTPDYLDDVHEP